MSLPKYWRYNQERYAMLGRACTQCGTRFLSPRLICPTCHHEVTRLAQHIFPAIEPDTAQRDQKPAPAVSVIIPAYNAAATIEATLASIVSQDLAEPFETIVVDSSSDETPDIITRQFPQVKLIHRNQRTDPGKARNLAIARASGDIIACVDADCRVQPDWLQQMITAQRKGHPVVGGSVENGNPGKALAWAGFLGEFREFIPVGKPRLVHHVPTCNISYQRSIFTQLGGFPTSFYPQEDLLFHWRLGQHGIPIWFDPNICVKHVHRAEWRAYLQHQRRIGHITAQVVELTGEEGAFLARAPLLSLVAAPFLPLVKFLRTITHFANWQPGVIRQHWPALPALLIGLYFWAIGFVAGAWDDPLRVPLQQSLPNPATE
jgi:GT2 family glycosyltransferase